MGVDCSEAASESQQSSNAPLAGDSFGFGDGSGGRTASDSGRVSPTGEGAGDGADEGNGELAGLDGSWGEDDGFGAAGKPTTGTGSLERRLE